MLSTLRDMVFPNAAITLENSPLHDLLILFRYYGQEPLFVSLTCHVTDQIRKFDLQIFLISWRCNVSVSLTTGGSLLLVTSNALVTWFCLKSQLVQLKRQLEELSAKAKWNKPNGKRRIGKAEWTVQWKDLLGKGKTKWKHGTWWKSQKEMQ